MNTDITPTFPLRRVICLLAPTLAGCALLGLSRRSPAPETLDTPEAYRDFLTARPGAEQAARYKQRLAELELLEARKGLHPRFAVGTTFSADPGDLGVAALGRDTEMVFEGSGADWLSYRVTRIAPDLDGYATHLFARGGKPISLVVEDASPRRLSVTEPAGIPLVRANSFDARVVQVSGSDGLRFCFFSQATDDCNDGYELVRGAGGEPYRLDRRVSGKPEALCTGQVPEEAGESETQVHAHHGYLMIELGGPATCQVNDDVFGDGFFLLSDASAITVLDIDLNGGSSAPIHAPASALIGVQAGEDPLTLGKGAGAEDYNAFVTDFNAYLAALGGADLPGSFTHGYFDIVSGKSESDAAFQAVGENGDIPGLLGYLETYPVSAHRTGRCQQK